LIVPAAVPAISRHAPRSIATSRKNVGAQVELGAALSPGARWRRLERVTQDRYLGEVIRGDTGRARISLSHDPPSGEIRDPDHRDGTGASRSAETLLVVPALRKPTHRLRERGRRPAGVAGRSPLSQRSILNQS
jgi:hypothetical protein